MICAWTGTSLRRGEVKTSCDGNFAAAYLRRDPVFDGVFHDRLQQQRRDTQLGQRPRHVDGHPKAPLEACVFDVEVRRDQLVFTAEVQIERRFRRVGLCKDAVNTHGPHAFSIEQAIGGVEQPLTDTDVGGFRAFLRFLRHS